LSLVIDLHIEEDNVKSKKKIARVWLARSIPCQRAGILEKDQKKIQQKLNLDLDEVMHTKNNNKEIKREETIKMTERQKVHIQSLNWVNFYFATF